MSDLTPCLAGFDRGSRPSAAALKGDSGSPRRGLYAVGRRTWAAGSDGKGGGEVRQVTRVAPALAQMAAPCSPHDAYAVGVVASRRGACAPLTGLQRGASRGVRRGARGRQGDGA